jgi:hypothetical protein
MRLFVLFGYDVMLLWCGSEQASANAASTLHHSVSFHAERRSNSIEHLRCILLVYYAVPTCRWVMCDGLAWPMEILRRAMRVRGVFISSTLIFLLGHCSTFRPNAIAQQLVVFRSTFYF